MMADLCRRRRHVVLDHGQEVTGWVLGPCNVGAPILCSAAQDPLLVSLRTGVVMLEPDASTCQVVDRGIDVVYDEVQNGEGGRLVITFRISKDRPTAGKMQPHPYPV